MKVQQVLETCIYASDLTAAERFYGGLLGLRVIARRAGRHVFFRCGGRVFLVFNPEVTAERGEVPAHGARGPGHVAFAARLCDIPAWKTLLTSNGVTIEQEVSWPGAGRSLYFRDPAGNSVELATPEIWSIEEDAIFTRSANQMRTHGAAQHLEDHILPLVKTKLRELKDLAERAIAQVGDEAVFRTLDAESNSIAIIMKHLSGNMCSRWTEFLSSDGEKPDRNRDTEFVIGEREDRTVLFDRWEAGWRRLFDTLDDLDPGCLTRVVRIRAQPHSVMEAIQREMAHYAYHVGQIVFLAKHLCSGEWQSLSVPRGKSAEYNAAMFGKGSPRRADAP